MNNNPVDYPANNISDYFEPKANNNLSGSLETSLNNKSNTNFINDVNTFQDKPPDYKQLDLDMKSMTISPDLKPIDPNTTLPVFDVSSPSQKIVTPHNLYLRHEYYITKAKMDSYNLSLNSKMSKYVELQSPNLNELLQPVQCVADNLELHCNDIEDVVLKEIKKADIVLGCSGWISNLKFLESLVEKEGCSLISSSIDLGSSNIEIELSPAEIDNVKYECLRLIKTNLTNSMLHSKFLLFFQIDTENKALEEGKMIEGNIYVPYAFISGSYNFTNNSNNNRENILLVRNKLFASKLFEEWKQLYKLSCSYNTTTLPRTVANSKKPSILREIS
jgi:hypothetical protein